MCIDLKKIELVPLDRSHYECMRLAFGVKSIKKNSQQTQTIRSIIEIKIQHKFTD